MDTGARLAILTEAPLQEIAEGKLYVGAAKAANVKLLIWSGLEDMAALSDGKYTRVDHFDGKAQVTRYAKDIGVPFVNVTAGAYMQNYLGWTAPIKQPNGTYAIASPAPPSARVPLLDANLDYGLFVRKAIESPGEEVIYAHSEFLTHAETAEKIAKRESDAVSVVLAHGDDADARPLLDTGKPVVYVQVSTEQYVEGVKAAGLSEYFALEFSDMWLAVAEYGCKLHYLGCTSPATDSARMLARLGKEGRCAKPKESGEEAAYFR